MHQFQTVFITTAMLLSSPVAMQNDTVEVSLQAMQEKVERISAQAETHPGSQGLQESLKKAEELYSQAEVTASCIVDEIPENARAGVMSESANNGIYKSRIQELELECLALVETPDYFNGYYDIEGWRKDVVTTAESLKGKISYEWDSKPAHPGWDERWDEAGTGLDCSGFVKWAYWTATDEEDGDLVSTYSIAASKEEIPYEELKPGDIGMINDCGTYYTVGDDGTRFWMYQDAVGYAQSCGLEEEDIRTHTNHVGIYAGKDEDGNDIWIHCKGKPENTVVEEAYQRFTHYYRIREE